MTTAYATSQYREMQVQTTPGRLVVMLYDGALRFLHLGVDAIGRGDTVVQSTNLGKAQRILFELMATLDMSAGKIATDLHSLYTYCLERLLVANVENRKDYVEEVIRLLTPLRDAWEEAERSLRTEESARPALVGVAG